MTTRTLDTQTCCTLTHCCERMFDLDKLTTRREDREGVTAVNFSSADSLPQQYHTYLPVGTSVSAGHCVSSSSDEFGIRRRG